MSLTPDVDAEWAFAAAQAESRTARVMIEAYLDGPQVSTEGLMVHGVAHIPGFADRNYEFLERFAPHVIENGGDMPSILPMEAQAAIKTLTGEAATALGLTHGPVKGDLVWHEGKPYVIELAARHSGGYFVTHEIPWNTGVDLLGVSIRMAMGEEVDTDALRPRYQKGVCQRYLFPEAGNVIAVEGEEEARQLPGVKYVELRVKPGDAVQPIQSHPGRAGVVMTVGATRREAQSVMREALERVRITTAVEDK